MQTNLSVEARLFVARAFFICSTLAGYADQYGDFIYVEYDTYIEITDYLEDAIGDVVIPSEIVGKPVTSIGDEAFQFCTILTSVTISDSITNIGKRAFYYCTSLTSVTIPDSAASIGEEAFRSCTSLTSVTIGNGVTGIGRHAFRRCTSLTSVTIGNGVTNVGDLAFESCVSLTGVTIPENVTSIGGGAFQSCISLTEITVNAANSAYSSLDGVLFDRNQTSLIIFPTGKGGSYTIPNSVTSIEDEAFYGCANLTSVTIPDRVTSIGRFTFFDCSSLTGVTIPDSVTSIGNSAFSNCTSLTNVAIPDSVTRIGRNPSFMFYGCTSLTSVTIPDSVTRIGDYAFSGCESLTSVYFEGNAPILEATTIDPRISASVHCFSGADNSTVYYLAGTTGWGATYGGRPTAEISVLPDPLIGGAPHYGLEGWFLSEWFGYYGMAFAPWLLHLDHGAIYRHPESTNASLYFYDYAMGAWWYSNNVVYPFIYAFDPPADNVGTDIEEAWLWYFEGANNPRLFGVVTGDFAGSFVYFGPRSKQSRSTCATNH